ncbi:PHB depolymerase family esterase [Rhodoblastus sp.]|uniref:alpha/beta hydrolase family esterase n=1 Tax=Rhodoblastus sp. TaxID=1962975 RepID=UPI0035AFBE2C
MKLLSSLWAAGAAGLLAFAAMALTCSAPASAARLTIQSGGTVRSAVVVVHERLKLRRRPLVIILHPAGGVSVRAHRHAGLEEIAESSKPVFLYPDALGGEWPVAAGPDADRDVKFLRDLVERFIGEGSVDPRRIYLIGEASGGALAYRAVCAGIGRPIAGLATLGAGMPTDLANCAANPIAFIAVNHVGDPRVPFAGGPAKFGESAFDVLPAETALAVFAKNASCSAKRDDRPLADPRGGPRAPRGAILSYSGCKAPVELVRLEGTGMRLSSHLLNHTSEPYGDEGPEFDSARKVWDFLKRNGA